MRIQQPVPMKVIRAPRIMYVNDATFIPSGMHGIPQAAAKEAADHVYRKLVKRGVHPTTARGIVVRAVARHHGRLAHRHAAPRGYTYMRPAGLSDDDGLAAVQAKAADYQKAHAGLIAQLGAARTDADKLVVQNAVEGLYNDWTAYAVDLKGGAAPYEWDRSNPVDAILIAVRDDLRNTSDLIAANKAQAVLQKNIALLSKFGQPGTLPKLGLDLPWYAWAGAAVAAVAGAKVLRLW